METTDRLGNYLSLLKIRQRALRRNAVIAGCVFLFALVATSATLLFIDWNVRGIWLMAMFDVLFLVAFLTAWARNAITKESIELLNQLRIKE